MSSRAKNIAQEAIRKAAQTVKRGGNSGKVNKGSLGTVDLKYARTVEITSMNTSG